MYNEQGIEVVYNKPDVAVQDMVFYTTDEADKYINDLDKPRLGNYIVITLERALKIQYESGLCEGANEGY